MMDSVITVRELRLPDDIERVAALYAETAGWHAAQWPADIRVPDLTSLQDGLSHPPAERDTVWFRVAEFDGVVVGLVSASLSPPPEQGLARYDGPIVYIGDIVVAAAARRSGVGTELMREVEHWARARGAATIALQVHDGNDAALELYRNEGFREVDIRMRKDLNPSA